MISLSSFKFHSRLWRLSNANSRTLPHLTTLRPSSSFSTAPPVNKNIVSSSSSFITSSNVSSTSSLQSHDCKQQSYYNNSFSTMLQQDDNEEQPSIPPPPPTNTNTNTKISKVPFLLADIGEGITEVELLQWYVEPGNVVSQFDRICEVQSDKATVEITSRYDGKIDNLNDNLVGCMIQVGTPLLFMQVPHSEEEGNNDDSVVVIGESNDDHDGFQPVVENTLNNFDDEANKLHIPPAVQPQQQQTSLQQQQQQQQDEYDDNVMITTLSSNNNQKIIATPAVRRLGMEHNIPLYKIKGSGPKGRILKMDMLAYIEHQSSSSSSSRNSSITSSSLLGVEVQSPRPQQQDDDDDTLEEEIIITPSRNTTTTPTREDKVVPIRGYHRLMVNSMTSTLQVPHMVYSDEINVTNLQQCRQDLKPIVEQFNKENNHNNKNHDVKLSFLPFVIKACSLALLEYPLLNSSINVDEMTLKYHGRHNMGIAIDTPKGLAVPVIKDCQDLSIFDIARELNYLQDMAMKGILSENELSTPTFTLSNIGTIGGTIMSPVVLPPQVAIGALGKIQRIPRYVRDDTNEIEAVNLMNISIGGDHRVIDGATLGRFCNLWKGYMEHPGRMMFAMK